MAQEAAYDAQSTQIGHYIDRMDDARLSRSAWRSRDKNPPLGDGAVSRAGRSGGLADYFSRRSQSPPGPEGLEAPNKIMTRDEIVQISQPYEVLCGVYFLMDSGHIVYVGQSIDVMGRLRAHAYNRKTFDSWAYIACHPSQTDAIERAYIEMLSPNLNADPATLTRIYGKGKRPDPGRVRFSSVRKIWTPCQTFDNMAAAARAHGVTRQCVWDRIQRGWRGWKYLNYRK